MKYIYVDDSRATPTGNIYDAHFKTVNDTLKYIRSTYKAGTINFFLDLDHDASDIYSPEGGDYIEILNKLEALHNSGKMRHLKLKIHFHSGNAVGINNMRAIVEHNHKWMEEV
jgi:hypothetical protein